LNNVCVSLSCVHAVAASAHDVRWPRSGLPCKHDDCNRTALRTVNTYRYVRKSWTKLYTVFQKSSKPNSWR